MRFSILLPTRNRLELLRYAVTTVIEQDFADWELIVSDNLSEQDIEGYVRSLNDSRVVYQRSASSLPVTDSWNFALSRSSGEYVIMLGDDDGLMKNSLSRINRLIKDHQNPDFIFTNCIQFAYPGVFPGESRGFIQRGFSSFFTRNKKSPWMMPTRQARSYVQQSLNFRIPFVYNMQHSVISRRMIDLISKTGPFFDSPYPDYFATNSLFLLADRILINPTPLLIIGVSPKSFGFYYLNGKEKQGNAFLDNVLKGPLKESLKDVILPGSEMNTSWLAAMEAIKLRWGKPLGLKVNYTRYRQVQTFTTYKERGLDAVHAILPALTEGERQRFDRYIAVENWVNAYTLPGPKNTIAQELIRYWHPHPTYDSQAQYVRASNLLEVYEEVDTGDLALAKPLKMRKALLDPWRLGWAILRESAKAFLKTTLRRKKVWVFVISPQDWQPTRRLLARIRVTGKHSTIIANIASTQNPNRIICEFPMFKNGRRGFYQGDPSTELPPGTYLMRFLSGPECLFTIGVRMTSTD